MNTVLFLVCCAGALPVWNFDTPGNLEGWTPNAHLADVAVADGTVRARAVDWDPFFSLEQVSFPATPWQYVVIRLKADRGGTGELFWTGSTEGPYGGLSQEKTTQFQVRDSADWQEVAFFPGWHKEGTIRKLRLDVYGGARFEVDWIKVLEWGAAPEAAQVSYAWEFPDGNTEAWRVTPCAAERFLPCRNLALEGRGWVVFEARAKQDAELSVLWETPAAAGVQSESVTVRGGEAWRYYNVEMAGYPAWKDRLAAFGFRVPDSAGVEIRKLAIAEFPGGPPCIEARYFGFENGVNRAGRAVRLMAQFENTGGEAGPLSALGIDAPEGLTVLPKAGPEDAAPLEFGAMAERYWEVSAAKEGTYEVGLSWGGKSARAALHFLPPLAVTPSDYVPEPHPVAPSLDVMMYYFPGWNNAAAWDCIRRVAPVRKPLLGYYDEANPECVDWQIKWASENAITGFLVDWYWIGGNQHLTHWFEAYRKARYRSHLKVAIMWANHNPPKTHTRADWRAVTQEWIDHYFNLDSYYRLNGKPALFLWDPENLRNDLGGSAEVRAALEESQQMARAAGYAGIEFVVVNRCETEGHAKTLLEEGYAGATNYHEWGKAQAMAEDPKVMEYANVVSTIAQRWQERTAAYGGLTYYPLIETGWDARPWHGSKSQVIYRRTVAGFEELCRQAKTFAQAQQRKLVVVGPANEWGEGSYIEPNTEFGFEMYEAVRRVFGQGDASTWPQNVGPADVGRGPYDFPVVSPRTAWDFEQESEGWAAMMNTGALRRENGALIFDTVTTDPAIRVALQPISASKFSKAVFRMRVEGLAGPSSGQLFWALNGGSTSEASSVVFSIPADGAWHEYTVDLRANPRWRGRIASLRFDPCAVGQVRVSLDSFALVP